MNNKVYTNKMSNMYLKRFNVEDSIYNRKTCLGFAEAKGLKDLDNFNKLVKEYEEKEYINDKNKFFEMLDKIKEVSYINGGNYAENGWSCNHHIFIINGESFIYKTGVGINCLEKNSYYSLYKLLIDAIYCILTDANFGLNYNEDDFIEEFGYTDSVENYKKGIEAYRSCVDSVKKCTKI